MQYELITIALVINQNTKNIDKKISAIDLVLYKNFHHYEILIVDVDSNNSHKSKIKKILNEVDNLHYICLNREADLKTAYIAALENSLGDFTILLNSEYDDPRFIPLLIKEAKKANDIVVVKRNRTADPVLHFFYKFTHKIFELLTGLKTDTKLSNFICLNRKVVNSILKIKGNNKYFKYINKEYGYTKKFILQNNAPEFPYNIKELYRAFSSSIDLVVASSTRLLKSAAALGFIGSILNIFYIFYALFNGFFDTNIAEGWRSTSFINSLMFSMILIIQAVICNYLAFLIQEQRSEQLYEIVDDAVSNVTMYNKDKRNIE